MSHLYKDTVDIVLIGKCTLDEHVFCKLSEYIERICQYLCESWQFGLMSGYLTIMSNYRAKTEFSIQGWIVRSIYLNGLVRAIPTVVL
jgi:hypothetical protein